MAVTCSLKTTNKPFGFPRVSASAIVGAVVSRFTVRLAAPLVALPNALATWTRNDAPSSVILTWAKVNVLEVAPGKIGKHTSELQSQSNLVCRLLLETKKDHI